jgi:hypothetical protein
LRPTAGATIMFTVPPGSDIAGAVDAVVDVEHQRGGDAGDRLLDREVRSSSMKRNVVGNAVVTPFPLYEIELSWCSRRSRRRESRSTVDKVRRVRSNACAFSCWFC